MTFSARLARQRRPLPRLTPSRLTPSRLTLAAILAAIPLGLAGCTGGVTTGTHGEATPTANCTADYCAPADWDTARASTPLPQIPPFVEPLNVVISARSNVSLAAIQQALTDWYTVATTTTVSVSGIHIKCISSENANVTDQSFTAQEVAWRLGGCIHGNALSLTGNEDHVRIWNQPVAGSKYGAWFFTASYETMCLVKNGKLQTASTDTSLAALHPSGDYHCVDGGPGTFHTLHPDGYDDGAKTFVADVSVAARGQGWKVTQRIITVERGEHAGEGGVTFNNDVYLLTITKTTA
jgi:FlaG/FlaF family flagellin (archaellin)